MTDLLHQAQLLSDLSGNSEVADKLGKAQQAVQLAQSVAGTAGEVAGYLSQGDVLGAGAALLGLGGGLGTPSGLQFTFEVTGLPPMTFSVVSFDYRAHYSELYSLSLHLTSSLPSIPTDSVLEQSGCLTIWQDGQSIQTLSGMVSSFAQGDTGFSQTAYFLEVRPDLWRTTLRHNARIFQQKNLTTILSTLLTEHGITQYAFAFTQSHPTREFCVQWQESDFEFIQRLSAEEGVFYYFEQRDRQYTLVFSDNAETLSEVQTFPYNLNRNAQLQEKSVYQFLQRHRVKQSGVVLQDYTFKKPDWPAQFQRQSSKSDRKPNPLYEHFDYPGRFKDSEQGKAFTQYRLESLQQDVAEGEGQSNIPQLQVGRLLELSQHPNPAYNTAWQLIEVSCRGEQPQSSEGQAGEKGTYFTNEFKVIPRHQTWRPMQRTKPKVDGPQIARVVGPKGEEIFTDNFGRIRLQFLWDRESQGDDHSSCWIRVTQPWAGQGWGVLAIPRVGQEVLVDFLDGDPDQPIVTGRTYNAQQLPPGGLPQSKTQMAFRSKTYKGEGYNELLFEDAPGREQLNLHAQRDMNVVVLNDKSTTVNGNSSEYVAESHHIEIHQNYQKIVNSIENQKIGENLIERINGDYTLSSLESLLSAAEGDIIFETAGGKVIITHSGDISMLAKAIIIDGQLVKINCGAEQQDVQAENSNSNNTFVEGECIPCKAAAAIGRPVNPILGTKLLPEEVDFAFSGLLSLVWSRSYYSDQRGVGWLGQGWSVPGCQRIERQSRGFVYIDEQGREVLLPELTAGGASVFVQAEQIWVTLLANGEIEISGLDRALTFSFKSLSGDYRHFSLVRVYDAHANQQAFYYDERGLPSKIIDGDGRVFRLVFEGVSENHLRLKSVSWQPTEDVALTHLLVRYHYNPEGDLIAVENAQGEKVRQFNYRHHLLISHENAAGLISHYEYDDYTLNGKVIRNHTNLGEHWQFRYFPSYTEVTDSLGRIEQYHFNNHKELVKQVFADGSTQQFERDKLGRVLSQTDRTGRKTEFRYNEQGQLVERCRADNQREHYLYDREGRLVEQIDVMGNTSRYAYDGQGNLIMHTNAEGESHHFVYNEKGLRTAVIDPLGNRTHYRYNAQNQLIETKDCSGNRTQFSYNEWGELTAITDAEGHRTTYRYNDRHQLSQTIYADGSTAHFQYDLAGRLTAYIDGKGNATHYRYSLDDLPLERINALNHRFAYEYDKARRLIKLTNENQATYHFQYDEMNRLTAEVGFDKGKTTYHYNEKGELTTQAYWGSNGSPQALRETHFKRDTLGRIVQESISQQNGLSAQTDYQYDGLGRVTQLSDGENTQGFDYDKVGRLVQQRQYQQTADGTIASQMLRYHYDRNGNRTKLTLPNKDEISYLYYGSGHLSAIKYNNKLISEISRDRLHREITRTQGSLTARFKRDPLGRLEAQLAELEPQKVLVQRGYQYDKVGNLTETNDLRMGKTVYRYDKLGQIQLAGQELFHFDPAHNIIERESERIQNNQITEYQGVRYQYDEFGNLKERTFPNGEVQRYTYDAKDKLVEVAIQKPNQTIETWQYQYDVLGRRISKRLENQDNLQEFIWDGSHLVQEIDHKTNRTYCYIYSHPNSYEPLAQLVFAKNSKNPTACTTYYYHNDQIGVPRELTDEQGKLCWYGDYTGWGKLKNEYALVENIHQPFRLQNQYCDSETGLHYNFFRYYEPNVGRFTQLDPIGLAGGENLYGFAPNAQKWIDVLGLDRECSKKIISSVEKLNNKTEYATGSFYNMRWNNKNKCNLFIYDVLDDSGLSPPERKKGIFSNPITAGEWADKNKDIPGFELVTEPEPGDIVSVAYPYRDATGHVAIVTEYDKKRKQGKSIGAGSNTGSHTTGWPWNGESTQGEYIYRRCKD